VNTRILAVLGMGSVLLAVGTAIAAERTVTLAVDNMYCSACPYTVKQSLAKVTGVNQAAVEIGETAGFIKVVVDAETNRLLGAAVLANDGAELVHSYIDVMNAGAPYQVIRDAIHIHPTLAEVQSAVSALD